MKTEVWRLQLTRVETEVPVAKKGILFLSFTDGSDFLTTSGPSLNSATQPILCCIGQRVAGKPTQFLMERAIASAGLDLRAITVEVTADNFATAIAGMAAMKFMAVRFFPTFQSAAFDLLGRQDHLLQTIGSVTSATWSPAGWHAWHNWGPAICDWATQRCDISNTLFWLHGDSIRCRSLLAELASQRRPLNVVWSAAPSNLPDELKSFGTDSAAVPMHFHDDAQLGSLLEEFGKTRPLESICLVGDEIPVLPKAAEGLVPQWLVACASTANEIATKLSHEKCESLSEIDQIVACEAYDFHRWTGRRVDLLVLRDAYAEYCDF